MSGWTEAHIRAREARPEHSEPGFTVGPVSVGRACRRIPHSANARLHWAVRNRWNRAWKDQAALEALAVRPGAPYRKATVVITLRSIHLLDTDNAYACVKPIVDGLKGVLIVDDSLDHLVLQVQQQRVGKRNDEGVHVSVSPMG